nr:uncharacterized protein LOC104647229 [Solanum lycopersicum]
MNSVSKHLLNGIVYGSNAHAVWEDLKERFNKVNRMRIFQLHKEIATMSQGTDSVSIYHSKLKELWDEYDMIVPVPSCGCDKSKDYVEHLQEQRLLQFLSGLNDSYDHTRRQILLKTVAPSVNQAYAMIIEVESDKSIGVNSLKQLDPLAINFGRGRGHAYQGFTGRGQPYQQLSGVEVDNNYC